jgi:hypothetical protein
MAAPPSVWQQNMASLAAAGEAAAVLAVAAIAPVDADEKLGTTWAHVVAVAGSEAKAMDLTDLMAGAQNREDTFQFPVPGVSSCCTTQAPQHDTMRACFSYQAVGSVSCPSTVARRGGVVHVFFRPLGVVYPSSCSLHANPSSQSEF